MRIRLLVLGLVSVLVPVAPLAAQGRGFGRGGGPGRGQDARHNEDRDVFHFLLQNHAKIDRRVTELPDGVMTVTESTDPEIAGKIKEHVHWMKDRIEKGNPIRRRDPLFNELFKHTNKIEMESEETANGVRVTETSEDPYVAKLIKAHAKAVSAFVAHGFPEAMKNHPVPDRADSARPEKEDSANIEFQNPAIEKYGKVVQLPQATQQPRDGSKICVDLTSGADPQELNPAIEKVARFVNIYEGAGKEPAKVELAVVLHGKATLAVLNAEAYGERFKTEGNPNLDCLHALHEAGVEIFVCGQSLIGEGGTPDEVVVFVDVAVSALTSLVNLQADGYGYVPLK